MLKPVLAGVMTWIFMEYFMHRYFGHVSKLFKPFYVEHQTHHKVKDYFAPKYKKVLFAIVVITAMTALGSTLTNLETAFLYSTAFMATYLSYEFTHYAIHIYPPKTAYGRWIRKHHYAHHFINGAKNFAVMFPFIDRFFATKIVLKPSEPVRVPQKFKMDWLCDEHGSVKPEHQRDFRL